MSALVRFGVFEFSPETGELRRDGVPVKLQAQPARVLSVLVANAGTVVSRETLQREVWGSGTHVDFERGLNFCIAQIRSALRDSSESPRFVATIPKQGYRFIAPVQLVDEQRAGADPVVPQSPPPAGQEGVRRIGGRGWGFWVAPAVLLVGFAALAWWPISGARDDRATVVIVPFYNETGRPELDRLAKSLADTTVARLATPERLPRLSVIGNAPSLRNPFAPADVQGIARELGAEWVVIGQLQSDGQNLRLIGHLIRSADMKHVWAGTFDDPAFLLPAQQQTAETLASGISRALGSD